MRSWLCGTRRHLQTLQISNFLAPNTNYPRPLPLRVLRAKTAVIGLNKKAKNNRPGPPAIRIIISRYRESRRRGGGPAPPSPLTAKLSVLGYRPPPSHRPDSSGIILPFEGGTVKLFIVIIWGVLIKLFFRSFAYLSWLVSGLAALPDGGQTTD